MDLARHGSRATAGPQGPAVIRPSRTTAGVSKSNPLLGVEWLGGVGEGAGGGRVELAFECLLGACISRLSHRL